MLLVKIQSISAFIIILLVQSNISSDLKSRSFYDPKVYKCGDQGQDLVVNFVNKNYPDNDMAGNECRFRMIVTSASICQIRVDFVDTELLKPTHGECLSQQFEIEGPVWQTGLPPLCGKQDDQHFYLHLEQWTKNETFVDFKVTTIVNGEKYRFGVWLTQIDCSSFNVLKAPEGCTQYFLGEKGWIKSFNFEGNRYLNGESYQICIRPGKNVCGIRYEASEGQFALKKSVTAVKDVITRSGVGASVCGMDYLLIPSGQQSGWTKKRSGRLFFRRPAPQKKVAITKPPAKKNINIPQTFDRFCGGKFSPKTGENKNKPIFSPVRSNLISLYVRTSGLVEAQNLRQQLFGKVVNTTMGFRISYQQLRDCEKNEVDLSSHPNILNLFSKYSMNLKTDQNPYSYREEPYEMQHVKSIVAAADANKTLVQKLKNSTHDITDEDIWDYLDNENSDKSEETLYDFLS